MIEEDWKVIMKAVAIHARAIHFSKGTTQREQDAIADHMIGVAEFIEAFPVPPYVKHLSDVLDRVKLQVSQYRKFLWILARNSESGLHIPNRDLALIPDEAELLQWDEPLFDAVMLKGICESINQPDLAKPVTERPVGNPNEPCPNGDGIHPYEKCPIAQWPTQTDKREDEIDAFRQMNERQAKEGVKQLREDLEKLNEKRVGQGQGEVVPPIQHSEKYCPCQECVSKRATEPK